MSPFTMNKKTPAGWRSLCVPYEAQADSECLNALVASRNNRASLGRSIYCGCFHCERMLAFKDVQRWTDAPQGTPADQISMVGQTACCPFCGFDSVIGSADGFPIQEDTLKKFHDCWFRPGPVYVFEERFIPVETGDGADDRRVLPDEQAMDEDSPFSWDAAAERLRDRESGDHVDAHKHSSKCRAEIERSTICGCFYCLEIFKPDEITVWWDSPKGTPAFLDNALGMTPVCPYCGIDSVIGSASGYPIDRDFLGRMREYWF